MEPRLTHTWLFWPLLFWPKCKKHWFIILLFQRPCLNMITLLLWPGFYGPTVVILMGLHCTYNLWMYSTFITFQLLKFVSWKTVAKCWNNIKRFKILSSVPSTFTLLFKAPLQPCSQVSFSLLSHEVRVSGRESWEWVWLLHTTLNIRKKISTLLAYYRVPSVCGRNLKEFVVLISNSILLSVFYTLQSWRWSQWNKLSKIINWSVWRIFVLA